VTAARPICLIAAGCATLATAVGGSAQIRTTQPPEIVPINIVITDSSIRIQPGRAPRGSFGQFILVNKGKSPHTFRLGRYGRPTATETGFTKLLKPGARRVVFYFLDYRDTIPYSSAHPADRGKPAMRGVFTIY
jgi:hypothetical protein